VWTSERHRYYYLHGRRVCTPKSQRLRLRSRSTGCLCRLSTGGAHERFRQENFFSSPLLSSHLSPLLAPLLSLLSSLSPLSLPAVVGSRRGYNFPRPVTLCEAGPANIESSQYAMQNVYCRSRPTWPPCVPFREGCAGQGLVERLRETLADFNKKHFHKSKYLYHDVTCKRSI
jgi:hypothetical protein